MTIAVHVLDTPTDWWTVSAAWVQALGSIAAILAAIWISRSEQRRQAALRRHARIEQISLIQGAASLAFQEVQKTAAMIRREEEALRFRGIDEAPSRNLASLLSRVEVEKLRSPSGAVAVVGMANEVGHVPDFARAAAATMHQHGAAWPIMGDDVDEWVARAHEALNQIRAMTPEF